MQKGHGMSKTQRRKRKPSWIGRLGKIGHRNYEDYLRSPHWQEFREKYVAAGLLQKCIGCDSKSYVLHHITYRRLGQEDLGDVIPLCKPCHRNVHRMSERGIPLGEPQKALQVIHGWSDEKRDEIFSRVNLGAFYTRRDLDVKEDVVVVQDEPTKDLPPRNSNDYYKIARHKFQIKEYLRSGYTNKQIAWVYGVPLSYVNGYFRKYADEFGEIRPVVAK